MGGFNIQEIMSKAKQQYEMLQKKMQETVVESSSGGGTVTVKMDGRKQVLSVKIDPEALKSGDIEMLEDLIVVAVGDAQAKAVTESKLRTEKLSGGMNLPFKLPF